MASGSGARDAPAAVARGRAAVHPLLAALLTAVTVAVALQLLYDPWYLNYDARYALLWARDAVQGHLPEYRADFAPTPHPLQTATSALFLPFGEAADDLIVWSALLCFGVLVYLVFRLGAALFTPAVGVVTALAVLTRPALQRDTLLAYQDVPFAALIVGAVLLEARTRRRGAPVLALLVVAGLLRPEAWVLAGLYVLWLWPALTPRRRLLFAAAAGLAPAIWAGTDWFVTGDPLHSLHGTAALAEAVDRRRHVSQVPYWTAQYFGFVLREPVLAGVVVGLVLAYVLRLRQALLPLAVAGAMTAVFAVGPVFGLPLIGRYIRTPSILLALFFGLAVAGWALLPAGRARRAAQVAAALVVLLTLAFVPRNVAMLERVDRRMELDAALYADLRATGQDPRVRAALAACGPLTTADHRPIPFIRWWLDGPPGSVGTIKGGASPLGRLHLMPRRTRLTLRIFRENFPTAPRPAGYARLYRNRSWVVYAQPGCVRRPRA